AEALTTELRLATERLLGDERVRTCRARVDLVLDEVVQLHHVEVGDGDLLLERLAGAAVAQLDLALLRQACLAERALDRRFLRAVEDGRGKVHANRLRGPSKVRLQDLRSEE